MDDQASDTTDMIDTSDDFESAYEAYAQGIYRFLLWRTQDSDLSEDLTSSVFEKAWQKRTTFHGGSLKSWLFRIAHNTLIDHWRKVQPLPLFDDDAIADESHEPTSEILDKTTDLERLHVALAILPDDVRSVVELRFIERLSAKEVGRRLGLSENNVRVIQYRALKKLKEYLS